MPAPSWPEKRWASVGLGAIGSLVARLGLDFGMDVVGFDPALSVEAAWRLPSEVRRMKDVQTLLGRSDFISLHLPVLDSTRGTDQRGDAEALSARQLPGQFCA